MIGDINVESHNEKSALTKIILGGNKDHLDTKNQVESLRKQFGQLNTNGLENSLYV